MSFVPEGMLPDGHLPEGHIPETSDGGSTPSPSSLDVRQRFAVGYPYYTGDEPDFYALRPAVKDPSEQLKVQLDFFLWCANFWRPNESMADQEHFYPLRANGLIYKSSGGRTGLREPFWPRTAALTVVVAGVTYTAVVDAGQALNEVSNPTAAPDPAGLTIADVSVSESTRILATYAGGTVGSDFDAVYSFTLNGAPRIARQRVMVRKR